MKRDRAIVDKRRMGILKTLLQDSNTSVEKLAQIYEVSPITIRRDLQYLEDNNMVTRFYGGAKPTDYANQRNDSNNVQIYRDLIAQYAASLVEDGDIIFINTSETALGMINFIDSKNVTVITNNGKVLNQNIPSNINVLLTGGEIRIPKEALVGEFAERNIMNVNAKKAFLGCSGISVEGGVTTENANEVKLNELMLRQASKENYILADHNKIGFDSSFKTSSTNLITNLITDERANPEELKELEKTGIKIHQVKRKSII